MQPITELVESLEREGATFRLEGEKIKLQLPKVGIGRETIEQLRKNKSELIGYLKARMSRSQPVTEAWPEECLRAERRFGQPHARLFPLVGKRVWTPGGMGRLEQVFRDRAMVVLDASPQRATYFRPEEVLPAVIM